MAAHAHAFPHTLSNQIPQPNFHSTTTKPKSLKPHCLKPCTPRTPSSSSSSLSLSWLSTTTTHVTQLSLHTSIPQRHMSFNRLISATVLSSLPTAKPEGSASAEKVPKWTWRAIKALSMAKLEARKLKSANTGTEALLMGVLVEGTSLAAKYLWANGITLFRVREEAIKLVGKGDMYFFPPEQPPLTEAAQKALDWAIDHKLKSGDSGEVTTTDLVLGIWSVAESPGHKILVTLGFNEEKAKELESSSSGPGFVDG